jgi:hypothetical protein
MHEDDNMLSGSARPELERPRASIARAALSIVPEAKPCLPTGVQRASSGERVVAATSATSFVHSFASQDWLFIGYFASLLLALALGHGARRGECIGRVSTDFGVYFFVLAVVRLQLVRWTTATALVYRVAVMGTLLASFFQLREILPAVSPYSVDADIYAFDMRVFGTEPSVWLDRFVTARTTEWFAFFYFLYFLLLSVHVLPMLFQRDETVLARFAVGIFLVFMTAHLLYMVVPGWGPYWYLKGSFQNELEGARFWPLVRETVDVGGAQKDIFPSLHTAVPTYLAIFSFRHRRLFPFGYTWPVVSFIATQIIIATMFLRWHYLVDVVAGLALAGAASVAGQHIADWERQRRERLGIQPAWMPLAPASRSE